MNNKRLEKLIMDNEMENNGGYDKILDALKDVTKIYDQTEFHLDGNQLFAKQPNEKMQNFITRQKIVAMAIKSSFPPIRLMEKDENGIPLKDENGHYIYREIENPFAKRTHDLIMSPVYAWQIMNRNTKENTLLMGILEFNKGNNTLSDSIAEEEKQEGIMKKIQNYFKKDKGKKEKDILGGEN